MQNGPEYKLCSTYPQLMYVPKEILVSVWLQMCADVCTVCVVCLYSVWCMLVQRVVVCLLYVCTACGCMFVQCSS